MSSNAETFVAHAEERIYVPLTAKPRERGRRAVAAAGAAAIYATLACLIVIEARHATLAPSAEEIPVEIVVEPPPPPKEEAPPPQANLDETPATDAPREGTADKDTGDQEKEAKTPPPAAPIPQPTEAKPSPAPTQAAEPTPQATPEPTPQPTQETPPLRVANGETPPPAPAPASPPAPQVASLEPPAAPKAELTAPKPFFNSVPDIDFGGAAMRSPVTGGAARATYLSILYGKIMPHFHKPADARSIVGHGRGVVVFSVDARGQLIDRWITEESGYHALDRAAFDAVGAGAPFPPPPSGGEVRVRFEYSGGP